MTAVDPQELLTPDEVCALLKMKRTWFYAQVARGVFRPIKLGRSTRVRRRDLEAYLSGLEHEDTGTAPSTRSVTPAPIQEATTMVQVPGDPAPASGGRTRLQSVQRAARQPQASSTDRHQQLTLPDRAG